MSTEIFVFLTGTVFGSFINIVIHRLPIMLAKSAQPNTSFNLAYPRSHCPACQHYLPWWRNIPLVSFIFLKGRCSACQSAINPRYFWVELAGGGFALMVVSVFGWSLQGAFALIFFLTLLALFFIDLEHQLLPDVLTLSLWAVGLAINAAAEYSGQPWLMCSGFATTRDAGLGSLLGYISFWVISATFYRTTGQEGLGQGDIKLLAALGAWLGWQALPSVVLWASTGTLLCALLWHQLAQDGQSLRSRRIPFGPALTAAGILELCVRWH